jgi:hypothetical protein
MTRGAGPTGLAFKDLIFQAELRHPYDLTGQAFQQTGHGTSATAGATLETLVNILSAQLANLLQKIALDVFLGNLDGHTSNLSQDIGWLFFNKRINFNSTTEAAGVKANRKHPLGKPALHRITMSP